MAVTGHTPLQVRRCSGPLVLRDMWGVGRVGAEVRFAALVVGHLGTALRGQPPARRSVLLDHVDRLAAEPRRSLACDVGSDRA